MTKKPRQFTAGLIYVINHSDLGRIIKRLAGVKHGRCFFIGDNPKTSTPSAVIGAVEKSRIIGQVFLVIGKTGITKP